MNLKAAPYFDPRLAENLVAARQGVDYGYGYKLADAGNYGLAVTIDTPDIDESRMSLVFPFADGRRRDGVGDLLEIGGIRTDRHRLNPVVLFDHGKALALPIAKAEDPATHEYTVFLDPQTQSATCKAFFYQGGEDKDHAVFCEQLFDLVAKRYVRAGSIGFTVVMAKELPPNFETGTPKGLHLIAVNMLEASIVVMPANQDTVRKALSLNRVCGKALSPMLVKSLSPYAGERKAQLGYEAKSLCKLCGMESCTCPVPTGDLSKTKVPPARWKPGVGAEKSVAMASNRTTTGFQVGDSVVARDYLFRWDGPKRIQFAKPGDRLRVVDVVQEGLVKVQNNSGDVMELT